MARSLIRLSHPGIQKIASYVPGKPIEEAEREWGVRRALKMASNENPLGPSPKAVAAARKALGRANRYPDANCFYLKRRLSKKFGFAANRMIVGNGSDELIVLAVRAFLSARDEILTAVPTFLIYKIAAEVHGAKAREIPMKHYRYDLEAMAKAVTSRTKIIFIANPDNPMGTYVRRRELERFIQRVPRRCLIFLDEAYYEYAAGEEDYPNGLRYLNQPHVVVSRTFSKAYGLSGLRVGYGFGHPEIIRAMNQVREPFNVNGPAQAAAAAALGDGAFLRKTLSVNQSEKRRLQMFCGKHHIPTLPSATNFILMRLGKKAGPVLRGLTRKGIIVRDMKAWGLEEYLRVTVGRPVENSRLMRELRADL